MIHAETPHLFLKDNFIDDQTKSYLLERIKSFKSDTVPGTLENYYYREYIEGEALKEIKSFSDNIYSVLKSDLFYPHAELAGVWINKVDNTANHNDDFHRDINKFSSITFLNSDFEGGSFEYYDTKNSKAVELRLDPFKTIILEGSMIPHRVKPVTNGVRYTLVSFWDLPRKETKTLL